VIDKLSEGSVAGVQYTGQMIANNEDCNFPLLLYVFSLQQLLSVLYLPHSSTQLGLDQLKSNNQRPHYVVAAPCPLGDFRTSGVTAHYGRLLQQTSVRRFISKVCHTGAYIIIYELFLRQSPAGKCAR
jgi:hypothetical protein